MYISCPIEPRNLHGGEPADSQMYKRTTLCVKNFKRQNCLFLF